MAPKRPKADTAAPEGFAAPPPDAPKETLQPVDNDALAAHIAEVQAINAANVRRGVGEATLGEPVAAPTLEQQVQAAAPRPSAQTAAPLSLAEVAAARTRAKREERATRPENDSDSPTRGIPRNLPTDEGRRITGGFGGVPNGAASYYPLDGSELRELVAGLFDQQMQEMKNDLRFHPALTYPRVRVRVLVKVEGWSDNGIEMKKQAQHGGGLPLGTDELPPENAAPVEFVMEAERREFNDDGDPVDPPDRIREELNLPIPGKRIVQAGATTAMVDVASPDPGVNF